MGRNLISQKIGIDLLLGGLLLIPDQDTNGSSGEAKARQHQEEQRSSDHNYPLAKHGFVRRFYRSHPCLSLKVFRHCSVLAGLDAPRQSRAMFRLNAATWLSLLLPLALSTRGSENWPQFRGPEARGIAEGAALPERWSTSENVEWKIAVPGRGWSSPIVWDNKVFLTTAMSDGEMEAPKKGLYFGGE